MNEPLLKAATALDLELSTLRVQVDNLKKLRTTANTVEATPGAEPVLKAIGDSIDKLQRLAGESAALAQVPDPTPPANTAATGTAGEPVQKAVGDSN